jgi:nucleotide-binding universal stress UspA family protein
MDNTKGRVVVGVDGSAGSSEAVRWAVDFARSKNWKVEIVAAWHFDAYSIGPYGYDYGEVLTSLKSLSTKYAQEAEAEALKIDSTLEVECSVQEGAPAQVLTTASEGADLLVVGSRGRGGFSSLLLGSVGQACVHHASCPVLVIRG